MRNLATNLFDQLFSTYFVESLFKSDDHLLICFI